MTKTWCTSQRQAAVGCEIIAHILQDSKTFAVGTCMFWDSASSRHMVVCTSQLSQILWRRWQQPDQISSFWQSEATTSALSPNQKTSSQWRCLTRLVCKKCSSQKYYQGLISLGLTKARFDRKRMEINGLLQEIYGDCLIKFRDIRCPRDYDKDLVHLSETGSCGLWNYFFSHTSSVLQCVITHITALKGPFQDQQMPWKKPMIVAFKVPLFLHQNYPFPSRKKPVILYLIGHFDVHLLTYTGLSFVQY